MSSITKNNKAGIFAIFIASALVLGTISVSGLDSAFATNGKSDEHDSKDKESQDHNDKKSNGYNGNNNDNEATQSISQPQYSSQSSSCHTGAEDSTDLFGYFPLDKGQTEYKDKNTKHEKSTPSGTVLCGNNVVAQLDLNKGNNALGQQ
jgi:hypothetical protein